MGTFVENVCILGAGMTGIVASRYLQSHFNVTILEATDKMGGLWNYDHADNGGVTPMYRNLISNLPKQTMVFDDLGHEEGLKGYLTRQETMRYLNRYIEKFQLEKLVQFNTRVSGLKPATVGDPKSKWIVTTDSGDKLYDSVVICTGRYDSFTIPDIPGIGQFEGLVLHSKDYYYPEAFEGKIVMVVGAKASGVDIALDMWKAGVTVILSHRKPSPTVPGIPLDMIQVREPVKFTSDTVHLSDDTTQRPDVVIFATGYSSDNMSFIHPSCGVKTDVIPRPLYLYLVNCYYPTMAMLDKCYWDAPFLMAENQCKYYLEVLKGNIILPNEETRVKDAAARLEIRSELPFKYSYLLDELQFSYFEELAAFRGIKLNTDALHAIWNIASQGRGSYPLFYRNSTFKMVDGIYVENKPEHDQKYKDVKLSVSK